MADEHFTKGHLATLVVTSLIGVGFGAGWWFSAAPSVPGAATALVVAGVVVTLALVGWLVRIGRLGAGLPAGGGRERSPFGRRYGLAVLVMVVAIMAGARVLTGVFALPQAVPAWVLLVVGLHFVPFVGIFGSRRFLLLAVLLCAVAGLAAVLGGAAGLDWAWWAVPGFGGALVLWGTTAAALVDTAGVIGRRASAA
ncbi:hypothetical protein [Goodfellowiella coeruleoviolacea]|uniref:Uncharacterized protein n=1 Tax=Goodfellowiella coeruleoviolacea TaxID=334858 RepID=A0AAE3KGK3_9PSEU|nr:hypothetical protein [Goodfellowiella coeruleoviolacea]MCP2165544.1 hypothetical protein [Goodfellowiella coeruleoviolacea]